MQADKQEPYASIFWNGRGGWIKGPAMWSKEGEEISHLLLSPRSLLVLVSSHSSSSTPAVARLRVSASVCSGFSSLGYRMASHARFPFPRLDGASQPRISCARCACGPVAGTCPGACGSWGPRVRVSPHRSVPWSRGGVVASSSSTEMCDLTYASIYWHVGYMPCWARLDSLCGGRILEDGESNGNRFWVMTVWADSGYHQIEETKSIAAEESKPTSIFQNIYLYLTKMIKEK
jgi:hypothetical protein